VGESGGGSLGAVLGAVSVGLCLLIRVVLTSRDRVCCWMCVGAIVDFR
jgi:hypothetical protein